MAPVLALFLTCLVTIAAHADSTFHVRHVARVTDLPATAPSVQVWVPLPVSTTTQTIEYLTFSSDVEWQVVTDPEFGNQYAYASVSGREEVAIEIDFEATRKEIAFGSWPHEPVTRTYRSRALAPDRLVTLSPRIRNMAAQLTETDITPLGKARALYQYVLGSMRYDKQAPGWGNGDSERACDVGSGNCTDFHSLFIALARAAGIPARFVMGIPLPSAGGVVPGYHCWAEFYVDGCGWIPVDISDAAKADDPARREHLFGNLDAERLQITTGRDIALPFATTDPLNYSFYPHAEASGRTVGCASLEVMYRRPDAESHEAPAAITETREPLQSAATAR